MKNKLFILALVLISSVSWGYVANAATVFIVPQGGTGASTFSSGQLLYGAGTGSVKTTATTTASCAGSASCTPFTVIGASPVTITGAAGSAALGTTSPWTVGNLAYVTSNAAVTSVATSSLGVTAPITFSGTIGAQVGGVGGSFGCTNASSGVTGCLTGTDWNTFNNKQAAISTSFPLAISGGTLSWVGMSTSTALANTQVLFGTAVNTIGSNSAFTFTTTGALMTVTNATTTALTAANYLYAGSKLTVGSTTPAFPFVVNTVGSDFYITSTGEVVGYDVTNAFNGRITPTRLPILGTGTTTTWTASTTNTAYSPFFPAPFNGTLKAIECLTDASFVGVNVKINGTSVTPSYFIASSTAGYMVLSGSVTFTKGQKISADFGTTTTASTLAVNCTLYAVETP